MEHACWTDACNLTSSTIAKSNASIAKSDAASNLRRYLEDFHRMPQRAPLALSKRRVFAYWITVTSYRQWCCRLVFSVALSRRRAIAIAFYR
jgi:hypothetical protein